MSDHDHSHDGGHAAAHEAEAKPGLSLWQKGLFALAILVMVAGLVLKSQGSEESTAVQQSAIASGGGGAPGASGLTAQGSGAGGSSLAPTGDGGFQIPGLGDKGTGEGGDTPIPDVSSGSAAADDGLSSWSPLFIKGGFSFAIAFAVGYALRTFFKMATFFVGAIGLVLFAMSYWGGVDLTPIIDKGSDLWDAFAGKVQAEAGEFKKFMTGSLPSAGAATVGLLSGFKKG